jgi:hypothetical protein
MRASENLGSGQWSQGEKGGPPPLFLAGVTPMLPGRGAAVSTEVGNGNSSSWHLGTTAVRGCEASWRGSSQATPTLCT